LENQPKVKINIVRPTGVWHPEVFDEVCELLTYSCQELGYSVRTQFDKFDESAVNIFISLYFPADYLRSAPKGSIIFQMENLAGGSEYFQESIARASKFAKNFEFWDYSLANVEVLKSQGALSVKFFEFGYCKSLERYSSKEISERTVDVVFYGHLNSHRILILNQIRELGLQVEVIQEMYGIERDRIILNSKVVLNLHSEGSNFEIVRVFHPLNNRMLVVSERNPETSIFHKYSDYIVPFSKDEIAMKTYELLSNPEEMRALAHLKYEEYKKSSSTEVLKALLS
jgi:hypothetical protein